MVFSEDKEKEVLEKLVEAGVYGSIEEAIKETERAKERKAKLEDLKHEIVDEAWVEKRRKVARLWKK